MMYKNKITGNVIDIPCELFGDDWEKLESIVEEEEAVEEDEAVRNDK